MRRINLFLILTAVSVASLVAVLATGYVVLTEASSPSVTPSNWMGQMWGGMGGMMGEATNAQSQVQNSATPYFGIAFVALVSIAVVGFGGLIYFVAFPEIRKRSVGVPSLLPQTAVLSVGQVPAEKDVAPINLVVKTLSIDERKVVEVLAAHEGKYLQKYIRSETRFSRLQIHRIVARLAEREIVSLEKTGNTNTVLLANWLK
jgi:uncharacterized membrane protein